MLQHGIGTIVGALVTLVFLVIMVPADATWSDYVTPLVIGALATFFWPVVIAFWLGRRAKARREDQIQAEVQRQIDQQNQGR
jgi:hypothetical protein